MKTFDDLYVWMPEFTQWPNIDFGKPVRVLSVSNGWYRLEGYSKPVRLSSKLLTKPDAQKFMIASLGDTIKMNEHLIRMQKRNIKKARDQIAKIEIDLIYNESIERAGHE